MKLFNLLSLSLLILLLSIFSCQDDHLVDLDEDPQDQEILSDSLLLKILEEEDKEIDALLQKRIVDTTGMDVIKDNPKKVYVHYLPWFQSKDYDGYWGIHWTMNNKNPDNFVNAEGKREIAAHYYPEIGPYSSMDPDLQEYHFLLMKMAGIDGVIFDWYGSRDYYDYGIMKQATETFMYRLEDLGLDFAVMYEDRTAVQAVDLGVSTNAVDAAKADFTYIKDTYFNSPRYIHWDDKPLIFVFGPHHIQQPADWDEIFTVFPEGNKPNYITLWGASTNWVGANATGEFAWVDQTHLAAHGHYYWNLELPENSEKIRVGSVYPGFNSFYENGGWGLSHNWDIQPNGGQTFVETLNYTHHESSDFIQMVTWNDFGEGTMIEPTEEFGLLNLQLIQGYTGVSLTPQDLQTAIDLYRVRKEATIDSTSQARAMNQNTQSKTAKRNRIRVNRNPQRYLDRAYNHIKRGRMRRARRIIRAVERFYTNQE